MSFSDRTTQCALNSSFQGKIRAAAIDYAIAVTTESSSTTGHDIRQSYADSIFTDTSGLISANLGWAASGDGTSDSSSDATIIARVAAVWNVCAVLFTRQSIAGVSIGPPATP